MTEQLYKVLFPDGAPFHGGNGKWSLPTDDGPGDWMPPIEGELVPCQNGYHLCREKDLLVWLGPAVFSAEVRGGDRIDCDDKVIVREARLTKRLHWDNRIARLFACDCAERTLSIYEKRRPDDKRPHQAIETARQFANGKATGKELAAARAAARDAARAARAARAAARDAARAAAWAAARDAARAARDAARAAAWDAAWAARDAARAAARDAARVAAWDDWDAAWDAARDGEQKWQTDHLIDIVHNGYRP